LKSNCRLAAIILAIGFTLSPLRAEPGKLDTSLQFLTHLREAGRAKVDAGAPAAAAAADRVTVTIKFDHVLGDQEIADLEGQGASFFRLDGRVAHTGPVYTVDVPWDALAGIAGRKDALRLQSGWRPAVYPLLDVSAHEIQADSLWKRLDSGGLPVTGRGMRIADFDTGVDVFHPSLFLADGDTLDWIDANLNGSFNSGDAVDKNRNGLADAGETLRYWDGWIYDPAHVWGLSSPANIGNGYQTYWDWLYNDANGNLTRDFGPAAGYTDATPGFGEPVYIALDADRDGLLDVGEKLVQLGTSKVLATMTANGVERTRGVDLIQSEADVSGHGTSVCGILAGGTVDRHRFTGIAPEAELLPGYFFSGNPISSLIPWAQSRGADVVLYEFGSFVWDYLDGSSVDEELISDANETIIQITPSGNLGRGRKHAIATVAPVDSVGLLVNAVAYGAPLSELYWTTLWRTDTDDLVFRLKSPLGGMVTLSGSVSALDGYFIWFERSSSPRGTCALNLYVQKNTNPDVHGTWEIRVVNTTGAPIETIDNIADDVSSWAGGAEFLNYFTDQRNVTWPATADQAFVNGSYSTRGFEDYNGVGGGTVPPGQISVFSGRGPRIDGLHLLDICSPGNYDVYSTRSHQDGSGYPNGSYRQFSGTSAAGPHVAAAAALIQQVFPLATMAEVADILTSHAGTDVFTGPVYNDTWGWGKLRILDALIQTLDVPEPAAGAGRPGVLLGQGRPNPFGGGTWIPFQLGEDGPVSVKILDVEGRLVKVLEDRWIPRGSHAVRWAGDDARGRPVTAGIYLCVLRAQGVEQSRKLTLLR
jgi:subtilisin family serine protease